MFVGAI